jgi:hypothetical protein
MVKNLSTAIATKSFDASNQESLWDNALADAAKLMKEHEIEVGRLRRSIDVFNRLRSSGARFPGTSVDGVLSVEEGNQ